MSGRRWKEAVASRANDLAMARDEALVVLGGPANSYTHYIATEEEYAIQRYEGASTLYGPHTLNAYINVTLDNLYYLHPESTEKPSLGPFPPNHVNQSLSFINGVVYDRAPFLKSFGDELSVYSQDLYVEFTFAGANPRNNLKLEKTYAAVEMMRDGKWVKVRDDKDWDLVFRWKRTSEILGTSEVALGWEIDEMEVESQLPEDFPCCPH